MGQLFILVSDQSGALFFIGFEHYAVPLLRMRARIPLRKKVLLRPGRNASTLLRKRGAHLPAQEGLA